MHKRHCFHSYKTITLILFLVVSTIGVSYSRDSFKTVYISPMPGSESNSLQTNIIIRLNKFIEPGILKAGSFLKVEGNKSGIHNGRYTLSDDGRTVLFIPAEEFQEGENVTVESVLPLKSVEGESSDSFSFSFSTVDKKSTHNIRTEYLEESLTKAEHPQKKIILTDEHVLSDSLPDDFPRVQITVSDNPDPDYIFIGTTAKTTYLMILDNEGNPVYYKKTPSGTYDFKVQPNGFLTYFDIKASCFIVMDSTYQVVDSFKCGNGYYTDLHELRLLPNGHALIIGFIDRVMDLSRLVEGGSTEAVVVGSIIQELDNNKNVVFQWRCQDYFNVTDSYADLKQSYIDFTHANAIDVDDDGNLLISFRNMQEVTKIDRETGKIIWRLGGKRNQFKYINDDLGFSWQHAIRRLANGNYLLFDNGFKREKDSYSRVLEYKLNEKLKTAELVWQFRNNPDIYSYGLGYAQRLNNGNTFICWGTELPSITEVRPDGTKAYEMSLPGNLMTYRAYRFPWKIKGGINEKISLSHPAYTYNLTPICDTVSFELEIRNENEERIAVNSIQNNNRNFYTSLTFPTSIPSNGILKTKFYFKPTTYGLSSDTFTIKYENGSQRLLLSGESPWPNLEINPHILDFGEVPLEKMEIKNLKVTNNSINLLLISSITIKTKEFSSPELKLPKSLRREDTLIIPVHFESGTVGTFTDTLFLNSNSPDQRFVILKGKTILTSNADDITSQPDKYSLLQNYPNPFNSTTNIEYTLASAQTVNLTIYNMLGQLVYTAVDEYQEPGTYRIAWNGINNNKIEVNSGLYVYCIQAGQFRQSQKMLMLK